MLCLTYGMRLLLRAFTLLVLSLLLVSISSRDLKLSPRELAAAPYRYNLVTWELTHLPGKWLHKVSSYLPWNSTSEEERLQDLREFFELGGQIGSLERRLNERQVAFSSLGEAAAIAEAGLKAELGELRNRRASLRSGVEETLESYVSKAISEAGLDLPLGLIFPPVDVALQSPPRVLVISPRDMIRRQDTMLLKPHITFDEAEALEGRIRDLEDVSALVAGISGVATYPTVVNQGSGLRSAAITAAHEWLHTYWFFKPLGWNFWNSPEMTTLNETAANLAGEELGLMAYAAITGRPLEELLPKRAREVTPPPVQEEPQGFNFRHEMHITRLQVDGLLTQGRIEEAEAYMEARRRVFVANGYAIRKLNQAYFAFYGTYADNPASVSPIGDEVRQLRQMSNSVGEFVRTVAGFGSYQEFKDYLTSVEEAPSAAG